MKTSQTSTKYFYIITMAVGLTMRIGDWQVSNNHIQMYVCLFWIMFYFITIIINGKIKKAELQIMKMYLLPHIVMHAYTIILIIFGYFSKDIISTNISVYFPTIVAISSFHMFGAKGAIKNNIIAVLLSWTISIISSLILRGPGIIVQAILQGYVDPYIQYHGIAANYFELSELVLAIGYVFVYYVITRKGLQVKEISIMLTIFIMMILGVKRISVLGALVAILFYKVAEKLSYIKKIRLLKICTISALFLCFLYVFMIFDNRLFTILGNYGINAMGREYYFTDVIKYGYFGIGYLGIGRNAVAKLLTGELSYLRVGGVHCDLLKIYMEIGMIGFLVWLWYYLYKMTHIYLRKWGIQAALMYFTLNIYTFILYVSDNVEIYTAYQILSIVIPIGYAELVKGQEKNCNQTE